MYLPTYEYVNAELFANDISFPDRVRMLELHVPDTYLPALHVAFYVPIIFLPMNLRHTSETDK